MNESCDVVVVGGGVIGLAVARQVRAGGASVLVLERGQCGQEASRASAGLITPSNPNRRGPVQALQNASVEMYSRFCESLTAETGLDLRFRRCGHIEVHFDDQRHRMGESEVAAAVGQVTPDGRPELEMLTLDQARKLEPAITPHALSAKLSRSNGHVHPPLLLEALIAACQKSGVAIQENRPVLGLILQGDRVVGVETEQGQIRADKVVLCGGAWSTAVDARLAPLVATHPVRGQTILLDASDCPEAKFDAILESKDSNKIYLVVRPDGLVLAGATVEPEAGFDRRNTAAGISVLTRNAIRLVPGLANSRVVAFDAGLRPGTPDGRPIIGYVPGFDGLIAATGHYCTGVTFTPITAQIVAELILQGSTNADLTMCQPGRF